MNNDILFLEKQRSKQVSTTIYLLLLNGIWLALIYRQIILGQPFIKHPISNTKLLLLEVFILALTVLIVSYKLETQVRQDGIYVKFTPYHFSFRRYSWDTIAHAFIREYSPISEYKGWGSRPGVLGSGRSFTISGTIGLQLLFTSGEKLLIGTQKPEELQAALQRLGQLKPKQPYYPFSIGPFSLDSQGFGPPEARE
jgi:hypothetical protein